MLRRRRIVVFALAALVLAADVAAGSAARADDESRSDADSLPDDEDIEVIHVIAVEPGALPDEATAFGDVLDLERFAGEHKRLEDLLAQSVGVQLHRFGGAGERAEISIRGFSSTQVLVELDGVPLNGGRGNGVDLASLPLDQLEAVEVLRGGNAIGAGSGAMGGVVSLRTRRPDFPSGEIGVEGGSFGTVTTFVHGTRPGELIDLGFGYSGFRTQGDYEFARVTTRYPGGTELPPPSPSARRINNERERHDGHLSLGVDLGPRGYLLGQQIIGYATGGEPGLDRDAASETAGQQPFAHQKMLRSLSRLRWEAIELPGPDGTLEVSLSHRLEDSEFRDPQPVLGGPIHDHTRDQSTALSLDPEWNVFGLAADHRVRAELHASHDAFDASQSHAHTRNGAAVALRDDVQLFARALVVSPGVRLDWSDDTGRHFLPGIGVVASPVTWLRLKGNVARSFRNPAFEELYLPDRGFVSGNPDLDPERATHYDLGLELQLERALGLRDLHLAASVFRSDVAESILWLRVSPYKVRPENSGNARLEGIELSARFALGPFVSVFANHTELRAEAVPEHVRLPGRAERETSVRVELGSGGWWKGVGEFQRTGSIVVSRDGNYLLPSRQVFNASLSVDLAQLARFSRFDLEMRALWLNAALDNIGNVAVRDSLSFPQPGRVLRVGVEGRW